MFVLKGKRVGVLVAVASSTHARWSSTGHSFEQLKEKYEMRQRLLADCYVVAQVDGVNFKKLTSVLHKPNDQTFVNLMNSCARQIFRELKADIACAYGFSDEYSFVLEKETALFGRKFNLVSSLFAAKFTATFHSNWSAHVTEFGVDELMTPPCFRSKVFVIPNKDKLQYYIGNRQLECHNNYLYNKAFWNLVLIDGLSKQDAKQALHSKNKGDMNELLFANYGINYNNEPLIYRKGTLMIKRSSQSEKPNNNNKSNGSNSQFIEELYVDAKRDNESFWSLIS